MEVAVIVAALTSEVALGVYAAVVGWILRRVWLWFKHQVESAVNIMAVLTALAAKEMRPNGGTSNKETATIKDWLSEISETQKTILQNQMRRDEDGE